MLPTSLLALTASFVVPIIAASAPVCVTSADGYQVEKLAYLYSDFCNQLQAGGFASKQKLYDSPVVALSFTLAAVGECNLADCVKSYQALVGKCGNPDHSIRGTGNVASSCGTYNFAVWAAGVTSTLGKPDATLIAATIKTIDPATITYAASSTSTSAPITTSASATSHNVTSTSSHEALTETSLSYSAAPLFANATSTAGNTTSVTATGSTYLIAATTSAQAGTATKPSVGSTALGSGAEVMRVSGLTLVGVACALGFLL